MSNGKIRKTLGKWGSGGKDFVPNGKPRKNLILFQA